MKMEALNQKLADKKVIITSAILLIILTITINILEAQAFPQNTPKIIEFTYTTEGFNQIISLWKETGIQSYLNIL